MNVEIDSFFKGRPRASAETSLGPCDLPILYRSGSLLGFMYKVDPKVARGIMGDLPLDPFLMLGHAIALLGFFEYRDTTIGDYREIGLAILVKRSGPSPSLLQLIWNLRGQQSAGLYIVHLPVNSEIAWASGVELWGFPKYLTKIRTSFQTHNVEILMANEIQLTYWHSPGFVWKGFPFITFSVKGKRLIRTVTDIDYRLSYSRGSNVELKIVGSGPTADTIKMLDLESVSPLLAFYTNELKAVLPMGIEVAH